MSSDIIAWRKYFLPFSELFFRFRSKPFCCILSPKRFPPFTCRRTCSKGRSYCTGAKCRRLDVYKMFVNIINSLSFINTAWGHCAKCDFPDKKINNIKKLNSCLIDQRSDLFSKLKSTHTRNIQHNKLNLLIMTHLWYNENGLWEVFY